MSKTKASLQENRIELARINKEIESYQRIMSMHDRMKSQCEEIDKTSDNEALKKITNKLINTPSINEYFKLLPETITSALFVLMVNQEFEEDIKDERESFLMDLALTMKIWNNIFDIKEKFRRDSEKRLNRTFATTDVKRLLKSEDIDEDTVGYIGIQMFIDVLLRGGEIAGKDKMKQLKEMGLWK